MRYLHLDTIWVQGAMRVRKPQAIELEYVQRMMAWMLLRPLDTLADSHAVQLGLGAAAITKFCHRMLRMKTTAVEINPSVVQACRLWFHLPPDDERLEVLEEDAGVYVERAASGSVDVLCVDLYDHEAASPVLDDEAFYAGCYRLLADNGVLSVNLFGRDASFATSVARIVAAFGESSVWSLRPTKEGNTVVLATRNMVMPDRAVLVERAEAIQSTCELPAKKWVRMIRTGLAD
ncbi:MAG: spermidine synthase [Rhizobacter sp.]|nr:spermidine synthase [Rhizobacter sp.]